MAGFFFDPIHIFAAASEAEAETDADEETRVASEPIVGLDPFLNEKVSSHLASIWFQQKVKQ